VLRFARIAPLLFLVLVLLSVLHTAGLENFVVSPKTGGLGRALIAALTFHVNLLEARRGYLPGSWDVLWSLSVEETFYLVFPLLCRAVGRGIRLAMILSVLVVLGPLARTIFSHGNEVWQEYSYLGGMDAIALGCLTAMAISRATISRSTLRALGGIGMALMGFSLGLTNQAEAWGLERTGLDMSVLAAGSCMVIAAAAQSRWSSPLILTPVIQLGRRSYEVYLTHMFVVFSMFALFTRAGRPLPAVPILFIAAIVGSGLLGALVAGVYSEPMNRLIRQFARLPQQPMKISPS
jgi:peptidoglycan/LPS O-acetylase OafA/YrhL